jgi:uncharacterized protein (TIGR03437 family)
MRSSSVLLIAFGMGLAGQTAPAIVGSGYALPSPVYVAPGQLVTLIAQGLGDGITQTVQAPANANLPATLAGVSVSFWQGTTLSAPILEVHPFFPCSAVYIFQCNELAGVTVQIPFEAQSVLPAGVQVQSGQMTVSVTSDPTALLTEVTVLPLTDHVHVLTSCDPFMSTIVAAPFPTGLPCPQIVAHADGSTVSATNPAKPGEELIAYAVGLGQTSPASVTGQIVTQSAPTQATFALDFNYHPNALPSRPLPTGPQPLLQEPLPATSAYTR